MNRIAFELNACIVQMRAEQVDKPNRDLSIAITNAETALMWLNRYVFSAVGQSGKAGPKSADLTDLDRPGG